MNLPNAEKKERLSPWWLFAVVLSVYVLLALFGSTSKGMTTTNGDEPHYLLAAHSLVFDGDYDLVNNYANKDYRPFFENDIDEHILYYQGRAVFAHEVLGLPLAIAVPYGVGGRTGVLLFLSLLMATGMTFLYQAARAYAPEKVAFASVLFCALTYPVVVYSQQIFPDTVAFVLVSFMLAQIVNPTIRSPRLNALTVGLALGLLPHFHYRYALLSLTLYLFFLLRSEEGRALRLKWSIAPPLLLGAALVLWISWLYGEFSVQALGARSRGFFARDPLPGILGLWFDQEYGLFFYAPAYLMALVGAWALWRSPETRRDAFFLTGVYVLTHLVSGSYYDWNGGLSPVPRYLIPVLPILVIFLTRGVAAYVSAGLWLHLAVLAGAAVWLTRLVLFVHRPFMFGYMQGSNTILRDYYGIALLIEAFPSFLAPPSAPAYLRLALLAAVTLVLWMAGIAATRGWQGARLGRRSGSSPPSRM